jgi:hypothetical protein
VGFLERCPVRHRITRPAARPPPSPAPNHGNSDTSIVDRFSEISVKEGQKVTKDQTKGKSGKAGKSTGAHARYEERHDGRPHALIRSSEVQTKVTTLISRTSAVPGRSTNMTVDFELPPRRNTS